MTVKGIVAASPFSDILPVDNECVGVPGCFAGRIKSELRADRPASRQVGVHLPGFRVFLRVLRRCPRDVPFRMAANRRRDMGAIGTRRGITSRARFELEQIIGEERLAYPWKKGALPSEINTELKKLKASADRLYEGLRTVSIGAAHALMSVNAPEHGLDDDPFLKAFETTPDDFAADLELFGSYGAAFRGLRDWLGCARATKGRRPLERSIHRLDRFLKRYTDRGGFVRTSQPKRKVNPRGAAGHHEFAVTVVGLMFGEDRYKPKTIDDVIKNTIRLRQKPKPRGKGRRRG